VKTHRRQGQLPGDWASFDADRACVECFFGRLKRVFAILSDSAFRLSWDKLEPSVEFCVALMNFRHRFRGYALSSPPPAFRRRVPSGLARSQLPVGTMTRELTFPPVHRPDVRVALTPMRAFEILRCGHPHSADALREALRLPRPSIRESATSLPRAKRLATSENEPMRSPHPCLHDHSAPPPIPSTRIPRTPFCRYYPFSIHKPTKTFPPFPN
jgi:hypothetical protein